MSEGYMHVVLIVQRGHFAGVRPLYSRYDLEAPAEHQTAAHLWSKFAQQLQETLGDSWRLLAWLPDPDHSHPLVHTREGPQDRTDKAHAL